MILSSFTVLKSGIVPSFQGLYDATSGFSALADASAGDYWIVSVAGGTLLVNDQLVCFTDVTGTPTNYDDFFAVSYSTQNMVGATDITNGVQGIIPAPLAGQENMFLAGSGAWRGLTATDMISGTLSVDRIPDLSAAKLTSGSLPSARLIDMVGATDSLDGTNGGVPQPVAGDDRSALLGNGTWASLDNFNFQGLHIGGSDILVSAGTMISADYVEPSVEKAFVPQEIVDNFATGFQNQTDSTLSTTTATRLFSIEAVGSYYFWVQGTRYSKAATSSKQWTDTSGIKSFYFDSNGAIQTFDGAIHDGSDPTKCLIASFYWNATSGAIIGGIQDQRHTVKWPTDLRYSEDETDPTRYVSGMGITLANLGDGTLDTHARFEVAAGIHRDADLRISSPFQAQNVGMEILHRNGSELTISTNTGFNVLTTGTGRLAYDNSGSQTEATNGNYILCHVATSNAGQYFAIQGRNQYTSISGATTGAKTEWDSIKANSIGFDLRPIGSVVFHTLDSYINAVKAKIVLTSGSESYVDVRKATIGSTGGGSSIAADIQVDTSSFSNNLSSADSDLQSALETLDQLIVGGGSGVAIESRTSDLDAIAANAGKMWMRTDERAPHVQEILEYLQDSWTLGPTMSEAKYDIGATGAVSNTIIMGGYDYGTYFDTVETTDGITWSAQASLSTSRRGVAAFGSSLSAIAAGGRDSSGYLDDVDAFNGTTWSSTTAMLITRAYMCYTGTVFAGLVTGGNTGTVPGGTDIWDGATWSSNPTLNTIRNSAGTVGTTTAALVAGGISSSIGSAELFNGSTWSTTTDLPVSYLGSAMFGDVDDALYNAQELTYEFDGSTWSAGLPTLTSRAYSSSTGTTSVSGIVLGGNNIGALDSTELFSIAPTYIKHSITDTDTAIANQAVDLASLAADLADHEAEAANPHSVTATQVGNTTAQWNADSIQDYAVDLTDLGINSTLVHNGFKYVPMALTDIPLLETRWTDIAADASTVGRMYTLVTSSNTVIKAIVPVFNTYTDAWTSIADLPINETSTVTAFGGVADPYTLLRTHLTYYENGMWKVHSALYPLNIEFKGSCGSATAGLAAGGQTTNTTNLFDGTTWSAEGDLLTTRYVHGMFGVANAAIVAAGVTASEGLYSRSTEIYDGTTWSASADTNIITDSSGVRDTAGCGTTTASLLVCGLRSGGFTTNKVQEFDGATWTFAADYLSSTRSVGVSGTLNDAITSGGSNTINVSRLFDGTTWSSAGITVNQHRGCASVGNSSAAIISENEMNSSAEIYGTHPTYTYTTKTLTIT